MQHVERLGGNLAIVDKRRSSAMNTQQVNLIGGPIRGKTALIFDDMISTGGSIVGAVNMVKSHGAGRRLCRHDAPGPLRPGSRRGCSESPIRELVVTNSLPISPEQRLPNMKVISVAPAVRRGDPPHPPARVGELSVRLSAFHFRVGQALPPALALNCFLAYGRSEPVNAGAKRHSL